MRLVLKVGVEGEGLSLAFELGKVVKTRMELKVQRSL